MRRQPADIDSDVAHDPNAEPDRRHGILPLLGGVAAGIILTTSIIVVANNNQFEATKSDTTTDTKDPFQEPICSTPDYTKTLAGCIDISAAGSFMIAYGGVIDTLKAYDDSFGFNGGYSGSDGFTITRSLNSGGTYTDVVSQNAVTDAGTINSSLSINRTQTSFVRGVFRQTHLSEPGHPQYSNKEITISNDALTVQSVVDNDGNSRTTADQTTQNWRLYRPSAANRPVSQDSSALDGFVMEGSLKDGQRALQDVGEFARQALRHTQHWYDISELPV